MGTIFVAYGVLEHRNTVLEFAAKQAAASGYDLFVGHVQEPGDESGRIREEINRVIERTAPEVNYEIITNFRSGISDLTNLSKQKRLTDAILESDTDYEYVVMGDIQRNALARLRHTSLTKAILRTHAIPVLLVPV